MDPRDHELQAARARIRELEARLAERASRADSAGVAWLLVGCFAVMLVAGAGGAFAFAWVRARPPRPPPAMPTPPPPSPAPARLGASWYPQAGGPSFVDIDGDGTNELIGLAWEAGHDAAPLHVIALDRRSYSPRWHAGPYPSQWSSDLTHLTVIGDRVVVT